MKKCPFCAEEIQEEAVKCKHCGSNISKKKEKEIEEGTNKKSSLSELFSKPITVTKVIIWIACFFFWYISIPVLLIWFLVDNKKKLGGKFKYIVIGLLAVFFISPIIVAFMPSAPPPVITIEEPKDGISVQSKTIIIKGKIEPPTSKLSIGKDYFQFDGKAVNLNPDGTFSYEFSSLLEGENKIKVLAKNSTTSSSVVFSVSRTLTPEEQEEKKKAEEEAKKAQEEAKSKAPSTNNNTGKSIAITSQIVKDIGKKCRYFFDIRNTGTTDFSGDVTIKLITQEGMTVGYDTFSTTKPISPSLGNSVYLDANTCPVSIHGSSGVATFKYEVKSDGVTIINSTGVISSSFEDLSNY